MDTVYIAFALFLLVTAYNYLKPKEKRVYTSLKTDEAWDMITGEDDIVIIDVRGREEYNKRHIRNARNIPIDQIEKRKGSLPKDKDILVYCQNGSRSIRAIRVLEVSGFTRLYHMHEGLRGWTQAGHPVTGAK